VSAKHLVISSYSDLSKLHSKIKHVHFRKFISKKLLKIVVEKCPKLELISVSPYSYKRLKFDCMFPVGASKKSSGRPSFIENKIIRLKEIK